MTRRSLLLSAVIGVGRPPLQWMALDLASGVDSHHWDQSEMPVSMGSLLKPFLAIAYRATQAGHNLRATSCAVLLDLQRTPAIKMYE